MNLMNKQANHLMNLMNKQANHLMNLMNKQANHSTNLMDWSSPAENAAMRDSPLPPT
jgi:hypothetical protein